MLCTISSIMDVKKYYLNTYVKLPELGDLVCFIDFVGKVAEDGEIVYKLSGQVSTGDVFEVLLHDDQPYTIDYVLPKRGLFMHNGQGHFLVRIPARQWSRGVSVENTKIYAYHSGAGWLETGHSLSILQSYVNKPESSVHTEQSLIESKDFIVLSRRFGFHYPYIFLDNVKVGIVEMQSDSLSYRVKADSLFIPELSKLLPSSMEMVAL